MFLVLHIKVSFLSHFHVVNWPWVFPPKYLYLQTESILDDSFFLLRNIQQDREELKLVSLAERQFNQLLLNSHSSMVPFILQVLRSLFGILVKKPQKLNWHHYRHSLTCSVS